MQATLFVIKKWMLVALSGNQIGFYDVVELCRCIKTFELILK